VDCALRAGAGRFIAKERAPAEIVGVIHDMLTDDQ
jgi:hypothetical protein